jgi:aspartyl-tRNA(Asn)/glutamyl-tRNA(Gln) amidotransferase subunit A
VIKRDEDTIAGGLAAVRAGQISAGEWLERCLARIAALDPHLHAFLDCAAERARGRARRIDERIARGAPLASLAGVPLALKDVIDVAGMPTTANSAMLRDAVAESDAAVTARLKRSGAILLGKLAAWEFAIGGVSFGLPWPPALNPWNLDHDPGGSSSGSAVAVAAGLCAGAVGTDTGGSIREPAAWCGVAGLKPTYGLVSARGIWPVSRTLDHAGPMAWTSEDCALMVDAMAGAKHRRLGVAGGVAGLKIGVVDLDREANLSIDSAVSATLDETQRLLSAGGARLPRIRIAPLALYSAVVTIIAAAEAHKVHRVRLAATPGGYDSLTRQRLLSGAALAVRDVDRAQSERRRLAAVTADLMSEVDALVMPTSASAAPRLGAYDSHGAHPSLTRPWNVTGAPALSVCAGFSPEGLPIGVQIVAKPFCDDIALRIGQALEHATGTRERRPDDRRILAGAKNQSRSDRRIERDDRQELVRLSRDIEAAADLIARSA